METYRAIPEGYMTVGEVAKKMGVTVRTLQYYDREGLMKPSAESEGGRRLYTDKDLVKLHQILSLKSLGFSLEDIRERLTSLDTPADVAEALAEQAGVLQEQISRLSESLRQIRQLREEVLQMQAVDFKKYADIIVNLQMKNEFYYLIKWFDEDTLDHIRSRFDKKSGLDFLHRFQTLNEEIGRLQEQGAAPEDEECQKVVGAYWNLIMEFTQGDMSMLPDLMEVGKKLEQEDENRQKPVNDYMGQALDVYFSRLGVDPFSGIS